MERSAEKDRRNRDGTGALLPGSFPRIVWLYLGTALIFLAVDFFWLTSVAPDFYETYLGHLLRPEPYLPAAVVFYLLYIAGILVFAVAPGLRTESPWRAWALGGFLGIVAYGTFDLTSWAVFREFPGLVVAVDILWGFLLTSTVSLGGYALGRRLGLGAGRSSS